MTPLGPTGAPTRAAARRAGARRPPPDGARPTRVALRIERLVLGGVRPGDRDRVAAAFERELARLVADRLPTALTRPGRAASLDAGRFTVRPGAAPEATGTGLARAVYAGLDARGRGRP